MTTLSTIIAAGDWALAVRPGDRITAVDGYGLPQDPAVVEVEPGGVLLLTTPADAVPRRLYPDSHQDATVERDVPDPEPHLPGTHWGTRARNAVRRNPRYLWALRFLAGDAEAGYGFLRQDDKGRWYADRGTGVTLAAMATQNGYLWTEKDGRGWRITELGRTILASAEKEGLR